MALPTQPDFDAATKECNEPFRSMLRTQHGALLDMQSLLGSLSVIQGVTAPLVINDGNLTIDGVTDTPTVAEMTAHAPIFTSGVFQGLTP